MSFKDKSYKKVMYDSFLCVAVDDPVGAALWYGRMRRTAPTLEDDETRLFGHAFYDITFHIGGAVLNQIEGLTLPANLGALAAAVMAVTPNGGGVYTQNAVVTVYDKVDYSIPRIEKVYGINTPMYQIRGRRHGRDHRTAVARPYSAGGQRWPALYDFIPAAFQACWGMIPTTVPSDANGGFRTLWTGSDSRKRFGAPKAGMVTQGYLPGERYYYDDIANTYNDCFGIEMTIGSPVICSWVSYDTWWWYLYYQQANTRMAFIYPQCLVYPLYDFANPNRKALLVKALGIDSVHVDRYDTSRYMLEVVGVRKDRTPKLLKQFSGSPGGYSEWRNAFRIPKASWLPKQGSLMGAGSIEAWRLKFRLRDTLTNRVGAFSNASIVPVMNTRYRRLFFMVK